MNHHTFPSEATIEQVCAQQEPKLLPEEADNLRDRIANLAMLFQDGSPEEVRSVVEVTRQVAKQWPQELQLTH